MPRRQVVTCTGVVYCGPLLQLNILEDNRPIYSNVSAMHRSVEGGRIKGRRGGLILIVVIPLLPVTLPPRLSHAVTVAARQTGRPTVGRPTTVAVPNDALPFFVLVCTTIGV